MGHAEIFECLKREILSGKYDGDEVLPSEWKLAARFGVSRPTVSRSILDLRHAGLVVTRSGAATRLSKFAKNSSGAIGIVDPGRDYGGVISDICNNIEDFARRVGWNVVHGVVTGKSPRARAREVKNMIDRFNESRVAGVFMHPLELQTDNTRANAEVVSKFDKVDLPIVLLDYDIVRLPDRSKYDLVGLDNFAAGYAIGINLLSTGSRSIVFCLRSGAPESVLARLRGVACAVLESGYAWSADRNVMEVDLLDWEPLTKKMQRSRPDAVVCDNDIMAAKMQDWLLVGGISCRVAGFDGLDVARERGFVTVRQPVRPLAEIAFATMLTRIKRPKGLARTILLRGMIADYCRSSQN